MFFLKQSESSWKSEVGKYKKNRFKDAELNNGLVLGDLFPFRLNIAIAEAVAVRMLITTALTGRRLHMISSFTSRNDARSSRAANDMLWHMVRSNIKFAKHRAGLIGWD